MHPELFRIGNFPVHTYGVFLALAFLSAILLAVRLGARDGLSKERIYDLCLWMLLASLVGSKILMFFTEPDYRSNPLSLLSLDCRRLRPWNRAGKCARTPGVFLGRMLLGQTHFRTLGRTLFRAGARNYRSACWHPAASDPII